MLTEKDRKRVDAQVATFKRNFELSQAMGYTSKGMSVPTYDSQEDFDRCRPGDAGQPFEDHNEFMVEVMKGLAVEGVATEPVVFRFDEFSKWLDGKAISVETRAAYAGALAAKEARKRRTN
jgi:hypothetical protein